MLDIAQRELTWIQNPGIGYYPVQPSTFPYDSAYFSKYAGYARTPMGAQLNAFRRAFVNRYWGDKVLVDIGVGCGQFIESRALTYGYDVNPAGVEWLRERALYRDPYSSEFAERGIDAISCWDVLEHIENPAPLLSSVRSWVFVSIPVFRDLNHILGSKHYRPEEHFWYWTEHGFDAFMSAHGFEVVKVSDEETQLGREDILSFALRRREQA